MGDNQARDFIRQLYNDEDMMKQVLILANAPEKIKKGVKLTEEEQYQDLSKAASEMGYQATPEELQKATKEYFDEIGSMEAVARVFKTVSIASRLVEKLMP